MISRQHGLVYDITPTNVDPETVLLQEYPCMGCEFLSGGVTVGKVGSYVPYLHHHHPQ